MQALNAWLLGHDHGLLLQGPDPDAPDPVMHGVVVRQSPPPRTPLHRWDPVTVWVEIPDDGGAGVREPRKPLPPHREDVSEQL
ncbi:hypothetical protein [Actinophytocola glycyrrhizae]|uniref:PASTA domain-containing protein n=1 Tax=Actinophytocola glycyrrhizae TaxID=2044873 RepID=A0ABV9SCM2_9PSEU